jgi:hypothetical protein
MGREVRTGTESKPLGDCTLIEIETLADGAAPASPARNNVSDKATYASLAEAMRQEGAQSVADLGEDAVGRWEASLNLQYASADQIFKAISKDQPAPPAEED